MKTSITKLSSSFILISLSLPLLAKPVAQVQELYGQVFMVTPEGKTSVLMTKDHLDERTEVLVEEGGSVTLSDFYDATYQLTGGSHVKLFNKSVQLKKGKAWILAKNERHPLVITTANGHVDFSKSEFIATFDQASNKTQVLVVNGELEVSNLLDKTLRLAVPGGSFSFIDPEIENGSPRAPVKVGPQSLESSIAEFSKATSLKATEPSVPKREIASVKEVKKGEIIFISSSRGPASVSPELAKKYYKKVVSKKYPARESSGVPVKFFGIEMRSSQVQSAPREPASVAPIAQEKAPATGSEMKMDSEFLQSLKRHEEEQPRNPKELQSLIDELKSY